MEPFQNLLEMDIESCEYIWKVPFVSDGLIYKSPIFPKGDATLNWDIFYTYKDYCYYFILRTRSAPFGETEVHFYIKPVISKIYYDEILDDQINHKILKGSFRVKNFGNFSSNMDEISKHEFQFSSMEYSDETRITSVKIQIAATIKRQPKFRELHFNKANVDLPKSSPNTYAEELIRAVHADPKFYDVAILVNETEFKAHKNILAAVSPVLRAAMANDMLEKNSGCIEITDFKTEIVRHMMEFIYKGCMKLNHYREAIDLLKMSDIYSIPPLLKFCSSYLAERMSEDNILEIIAVAEIANADVLSELALDYFAKNPKSYKAEDFKNVLQFKPEKLQVLLEKLSTMSCKRML